MKKRIKGKIKKKRVNKKLINLLLVLGVLLVSLVFGSGNVNSENEIIIGNCEDLVPFYRFYNTEKINHFYTASETEKENLQGYDSDYDYQGIAGYIYPEQVQGTTPLYRFYNTEKINHFYTANETEKENLQGYDSDYDYQKIAGYIYRNNESCINGSLNECAFEDSSLCEGLVSYWDFETFLNNDAVTWIYDIWNSNSGKVEGNAFIGSNGKKSNSIELDGERDYIIYNDKTVGGVLEEGNSEFTISGWIKPYSLNSEQTQHNVSNVFMSKVDSITLRNDNFELGISEEGNLILYLDDDESHTTQWGKDRSVTKVFGNSEIELNNWTYFAIVFDSRQVDVYLNKNNYSKSFTRGSIDGSPGNFVMGFTPNSDIYFNGSLDEIAVWNHSLSKTEIENIYNSYSDEPEPVVCDNSCSEGQINYTCQENVLMKKNCIEDENGCYNWGSWEQQENCSSTGGECNNLTGECDIENITWCSDFNDVEDSESRCGNCGKDCSIAQNSGQEIYGIDCGNSFSNSTTFGNGEICKYSYETQCFCEWDSDNSSCNFNSELVKINQSCSGDGNANLPDELGKCVYNDDKQGDCSNSDFVKVSWTAEMIWSENNTYTSKQFDKGNVPFNTSNSEEYDKTSDGKYHWKPMMENGKRFGSKCVSSEPRIIPCPQRVKLGFFNWINLILVLIVIILCYYVYYNLNKNNKKKSKKKLFFKKYFK